MCLKLHLWPYKNIWGQKFNTINSLKSIKAHNQKLIKMFQWTTGGLLFHFITLIKAHQKTP